MTATKRNTSSALLWAACESEIDLRRQMKLSPPTSSAGIDAATANRTASRPHPSNCSNYKPAAAAPESQTLRVKKAALLPSRMEPGGSAEALLSV
jgi:hypothetical protein